jgi:hypothetical protein
MAVTTPGADVLKRVATWIASVEDVLGALGVPVGNRLTWSGLAFVVKDHVPPVTAAPLAVTVAVYVVVQPSAAVGVKVATPVVALKADVPATVVVPVFRVITAEVAFVSVAVTLAVAGSTPVAPDAGVVAVSAGVGVGVGVGLGLGDGLGSGAVPNVISTSAKYADDWYD